jgi:hypothetical protein
MPTFVLLHSPLVGPLTWKPVAEILKEGGTNAVVPTLRSEGVSPPYWKRHAEAVAEYLRGLSRAEPVILTAHSGAGPLLPAVRRQIEHNVVGYVFVDAGLPGPDGASRLDLLESSGTAKQLRARATDGLLPVWTDLFNVTEEMVHDLIPDAGLRRDFIQELRPTPLAVYDEPLPIFSGWPDAPCGYVKFSQAYELEAQWGRRKGWRVLNLPGAHFHMFVEPRKVAGALVDLVGDMGV